MNKNNRNINSEIVEVVTDTSKNLMRWEPAVGNEFLNFLKHVSIPEESKKILTHETQRILGRCTPPDLDIGGETGLVVGYVQSGKTMSFTAISALARDNKIPLLIVMAGISVPLARQSSERLKQDLRLDERPDRSWQQFNTKDPSWKDSGDALRRIFSAWQDPDVSELDKQTVLITVMKNHTHLKKLTRVLKDLNLEGIPALIIDDEADQASLNTKAKKEGEESTTYACIMDLCTLIPNHTFLQYTATPQAPLLINIIDKLSPSFTEVLTPGSGYIGGKQFFIDHPELVFTIPASELADSESQEPPDSLITALQTFFLGVATGIHLGEKRKNKSNRSMLIHPSFHTDPHNKFYQWVTEVQRRWERTLEVEDEDKAELVKEFEDTYKQLSKTVKEIPSFKELIPILLQSVRDTRPVKVNASDGPTPIIPWRDNYSYILIGGQAMDRGFTVEGLTVTYMSRGVGVGNADTIQQRARFFGYKEKYMGYCRIFVDQQLKLAFKEYVEHEEDIRKQLKEYSDSGKPLSEWKRVFLMPNRLNPTRKNILKDGYISTVFSDKWFIPGRPYGSVDTDEKNREIVGSFINVTTFVPDKGHPDRKNIQKHIVNERVPLQEMYEDLLAQYLITSETDSYLNTGVLLQLKTYLEKYPDETCTLYIMSQQSPNSDWQIRKRSVNKFGRIPTLFQGAYPNDTKDIYPGDRELGDKKRVVVQIHRLRVVDEKDKIIANDVRAIAIWIPEKMGISWLAQPQGDN